MIETIYIERSVEDHPRTTEICHRYSDATRIYCERYTDVFNNASQNFRTQKKQPSLILARKHKNHVLPTPPGYGVGANQNFYFSHMLNCLYDCRYCFLQGMYRSANYVVFVNYEDFLQEIRDVSNSHNEDCWFFSGYDCDSLAMEPVTGFMQYALPVIAQIPNAHLEIRTKSTQVRELLHSTPNANAVVAFSFTPEPISNSLEHRVPTVNKRIQAMAKVAQHGWKVGLRFDPIIYTESIESDYHALMQNIFTSVAPDKIHSVSYGSFRVPKPYFKKMVKLYPHEKLFALPLTENQSTVSFEENLDQQCGSIVESLLLQYISKEIIYPCS